MKLLRKLGLSILMAIATSGLAYGQGEGGNVSTSIIQLPSPLPNVGNLTGVNTIITDNIAGSRIVRGTDANASGTAGCNPTSCPVGADATYMADYSGNMTDGFWSQVVSGTYYVGIARQAGGTTYIEPFTPSTFQVGAVVASVPSKKIWWSHVASTPKVLYSMEQATTACPVGANPSGDSLCLVKYDYTSSWGSPTITKMYDFEATGNALASIAAGGATYITVFTVSQDDSTFVFGASDEGAQDTGHYVVVFRPSGNNYRVYNTGTTTRAGYAPCTITGTFGSNGQVNLVNAAHNGACAEYIDIHEVFAPGNGNWLLVSGNCTTDGTTACGAHPGGGSTDGPWFWNFGDTTATGRNLIATGYGGHFTFSYNNFAHGTGTPAGQFGIASMANPPVQSNVIPTANLASFPSTAPSLGQHSSWAAAGTSDSKYFYASWEATGWAGTHGQQINGGTYAFTAPYINEYVGYPPVAPGATPNAGSQLHRYFHTYNNNGNPNYHFNTVYQIGVCSQDGLYCSFSSDWMCTLGAKDGVTSTSVCGGADWVASTAFNSGDPITPQTLNSSFHTYHASANCTSGTSAPTWTAGTANDGGCTWNYVGDENERGDVFIAEVPTGAAPSGTTTVVVNGNYQITSSLQMTWTASTSGGVTGYNVYRSLTHNGPYTKIKSSQACCVYTDQSVAPKTTYYYVLTATDGTNESANSSEVTKQTP